MEEHKHDCDVHKMELDNHKERLDKIDIILEKVRNRPPVWASLFIAGLLAVIGYLAKGV